jgi:hypothetical protein
MGETLRPVRDAGRTEDVVGRVGEAGSLRAWRPERYLFKEKMLGIGSES